jgi:hypothetical protein
MVKRIDKKDITEGTPLVIPANHPDTVFLNPNNYISIKGTTLDYAKYQTSNPYATGITGSGDTANITPVITQPQPQNDVPDLTDIESVTYEQYYDSVSKLVKVKAILKIRNSSKSTVSVAGVDARIYNPNA